MALVAHPDDARYKPLFGTTVTTPLYGVSVPIVAHELAQPDKGTGIAMICTFGDVTDVIWWRELDLPTRAILGRNGRVLADAPDGVDATAFAAIAGETIKQAQRVVVEQLRESGALIGDPRPIEHPVKFYERGDRPLEIVASRQWYIRNGGRSKELQLQLIARGREMTWHPSYMRHRYENWVEGLNGDWLVSRQRFFGVPVPVWYRLDEHGEPDHDHPLLPREATLPIDPSTDVPDGFTAEQRNQPNGFAGDPDVFDTWATSSLTPQIAACWEEDGSDLFAARVPDGHAPAGPRHHPHVAVRHGRAQPLRARRRAVVELRAVRLDPRPRSQEDVEVEGQRRHADGPVRHVRQRCRALLGGWCPSRHRRRLQRRPDEGRPQAGHQAAQRQQVRARHRRGRRPTPSPPIRSICRCSQSSTP